MPMRWVGCSSHLKTDQSIERQKTLMHWLRPAPDCLFPSRVDTSALGQLQHTLKSWLMRNIACSGAGGSQYSECARLFSAAATNCH